jgi:hypothetical protein
MNIVKTDTYRSLGRKVNQTDDMVRVIIDMSIIEFRKFKRLVSQISNFCYPDCKFLSITEKDQVESHRTEPHVCLKYNKRVMHGEDHPYLNLLPECDYHNKGAIFLIEKGWIDPMENREADGYSPFKFVLTEEDAISYCNAQGFWTEEDCWSIAYKPDKKMMKYRYKKIEQL